MSRNIVTIHINGVGVTRFAADTFSLDISGDTVTMTCAVPNTQDHPITIDPLTETLLDTVFNRRETGERVTLADIAAKPANWTT